MGVSWGKLPSACARKGMRRRLFCTKKTVHRHPISLLPSEAQRVSVIVHAEVIVSKLQIDWLWNFLLSFFAPKIAVE